MHERDYNGRTDGRKRRKRTQDLLVENRLKTYQGGRREGKEKNQRQKRDETREREETD